MPINPLVPFLQEDERFFENNPIAGEGTERVEPSKTYRLDFGRGRIRGMIDGERALRQFIRKALMTAKFRFDAYDEYGSELDSLIGADLPMELLQSEIPRVIRESLISDDRIQDVNSFEIERSKDVLYVTFTVVSAEGQTINEEVTFS